MKKIKNKWPNYNDIKICPACGSKINKNSRLGIRIGECAFCGTHYKEIEKFNDN